MDQDDLNTNNSNPQTTPASGGLSDLPPLPKLEEAEDDTFAPPPAPPLPSELDAEVSSGVTGTGSPEVAGVEGDLSSGSTSEEPVLGSTVTQAAEPSEEKPGPKKKSKVGAIVGGVIALLLLVGVPMIALNIDKFRGDTRSSAKNDPGGATGGRRFIRRTVETTPKPPQKVPTPPPGKGRGVPQPTVEFTPIPPQEVPTPPPGKGGGVPQPTSSKIQNCSQAQIAKCESRGELCAPTGNGQGVCVKKPAESAPPGGGGGEPTSSKIQNCSQAQIAKCESRGELCAPTGNGQGVCVKKPAESAPPGGGGGAPPAGGGDGGSESTSVACVETRVYTLQSGGWVITALGQVGQYAGVGDKVRLAVRGNSNQFAKGRVRVNGGAWTTTTSKNSAGEFYIEYSLSQTGKYTIEGQVQ